MANLLNKMSLLVWSNTQRLEEENLTFRNAQTLDYNNQPKHASLSEIMVINLDHYNFFTTSLGADFDIIVL